MEGSETMPLLAFLLTCCVAQDGSPENVGNLIERLGADAIDERNRAYQRLLELGDEAVPPLKEASLSKVPSIALGAKSLLKEIDQQNKVRELQPRCKRVSIEFADKPFAQALAEVTRPYGLSCPRFDPDFADRTVSLQIDQATLWQALSAFCEGNQAALENLDPQHLSGGCENELYVGKKPAKPFPYRKRLDLDECRVLLDSSSAEGSGNAGVWKSCFRLVVALPAGFWVEGASIEGLRIRDDQGILVKPEAPDERRSFFECHRSPGVPTRVVVGEVLVTPSAVNPSKHFSIEGTIELQIPVGIESLPMTPRPGGFAIPGCAFDVEAAPKGIALRAFGTTAETGLSFQVAAFDSHGKRLADVPFRIRANGTFDCPKRESTESKAERFEVWKVTRTKAKSLAFKFTDVVYNSGRK